MSLWYFMLEISRNVRNKKKLYLQIIIYFVFSEDYWRLYSIPTGRRLEKECTLILL